MFVLKHFEIILKNVAINDSLLCSFASIQQPSLDVTVSVSEPLLPKDDMASSNLLRVTVETAYSVPDSWAPVPGQHPSTYTVALEVPLTAEVRLTAQTGDS